MADGAPLTRCFPDYRVRAQSGKETNHFLHVRNIRSKAGRGRGVCLTRGGGGLREEGRRGKIAKNVSSLGYTSYTGIGTLFARCSYVEAIVLTIILIDQASASSESIYLVPGMFFRFVLSCSQPILPPFFWLSFIGIIVNGTPPPPSPSPSPSPLPPSPIDVQYTSKVPY